jgi:hypothetical protein
VLRVHPKQLGELGVDAPGVDEVVVLLADRAARDRAPVRTARSMVLRGVCWLSTNCTTSTR